MTDNTSRIGKSWDNNEEKELINELDNPSGLSLEEIAKSHKRTVNGIIYRMMKIIHEKNQSGVNPSWEKFSITQQSMLDYAKNLQDNKLDSSTYSMARKHWSGHEENLLLQEINGDADVITISQNHHRSPYSIKLRILKLLSDKYKSGDDLTVYYTKNLFTEAEMKRYVSRKN